ncbi:hypothetical protein [Staphylococcus warneri]|uniref:hypothetical protein n=1 Tax=Staphylococcus warneri TaxID=1292 RepID=UPI001A8FD217|nr:hypothetical protein [Staphylococcus warneri]MBO0377057.1 hypothetical protein [Staphylococcus warneri]
MNKKSSNNDVMFNTAINFKFSIALFFILVIIFLTQWKSAYFPAYLSANITFIALFFKIEYDEHMAIIKSKQKHKRFLLAYLNDIKTINSIFTHKQYIKPKNISVDIETIDEYYDTYDFSKEIYSHVVCAQKNIETANNRKDTHNQLKAIIKTILLDNDIPINSILFEHLTKIQQEYIRLENKNLYEIETVFNEYSYAILNSEGTLKPSKVGWNVLYTKSLKPLSVYILLDDFYIKPIISDLINEIEAITKDKTM